MYAAECEGRLPRIFQPRSFCEKMQWRKLFGGSPVYRRLCDKLEVRTYISERGFGNRLVPLLWAGDRPEDLPFDELPVPFILKSTHASGQYCIARDRNFDRDHMAAQANTWLATNWGDDLAEPGYLNVPRRLVVEQLLQNSDGTSPNEYCFFLFDGVVRFIEPYIYDSSRRRKIRFLTPDWVPLDWRLQSPLIDPPPPPPPELRAMMAAAERVGAGFDQVRVDFLERDGIFFMGEITLYAYSGFCNFKPPEADLELGRHWVIERPASRAIWSLLTRRWGDRVIKDSGGQAAASSAT